MFHGWYFPAVAFCLRVLFPMPGKPTMIVACCMFFGSSTSFSLGDMLAGRNSLMRLILILIMFMLVPTECGPLLLLGLVLLCENLYRVASVQRLESPCDSIVYSLVSSCMLDLKKG